MKMSDLISRQAAIEAINKIFPADPMRDDYTQGITCGAALANTYIAQLPSAQPETHEERTETHTCDLISRQAAIDAHYEYCNKHPDASFPVWSLKILEDLPSADLSGYSDKLWQAAYERGKTESQQRWILCSEQLPEENGQYLITVKYVHVDGYDDIYAEHGEWTDGKWDMFCFGHCGKVENIIAWMPLPKPYLEEGD